MQSSDEHLERALSEYNEAVNRLEADGPSTELLDALINRGRILSMMDSWVTAMEDFNDAVDIIDTLSREGKKVDAGTYVMAYISRGILQGEKDDKAMYDDYMAASVRLPEVGEKSRFYDRKSLIKECIDCAGDLVEADLQDGADPFIEKALSLLVGYDDPWSRNRYFEAMSARGQTLMLNSDNVPAIKAFDETIRVGEELLSDGELDDELLLVYAYVSRGDMESDEKMSDAFFTDRERAIGLMKEMMDNNALEDVELLSELHGEIAKAYMEKGDMKKAESHLLKQVSLNLNGAKGYMDENNLGPRD
ncbi:hypothetical protein TALC_00786 [Thermoplasmatales archaeon BRNA1]|nr:hypothetical protein TALC_00786 [Thermoplasmatales archaeon BRNA1]